MFGLLSSMFTGVTGGITSGLTDAVVPAITNVGANAIQTAVNRSPIGSLVSAAFTGGASAAGSAAKGATAAAGTAGKAATAAAPSFIDSIKGGAVDFAKGAGKGLVSSNPITASIGEMAGLEPVTGDSSTAEKVGFGAVAGSAALGAADEEEEEKKQPQQIIPFNEFFKTQMRG